MTLNEVSDKAVCLPCNSGLLSQLDKELCSRSLLAAVASQQIDAHLWQAWDVDHQSDNLLVEARPAWAPDGTLESLVCYPQVTFERKGPEVRGDYEEFTQFGQEDSTRVLFKAVRECFGRFRSGEKRALHFARVRSDVRRDGYRLPPRIFTPHSISEIAANVRAQSFILRFASEEDKHFVLESLPNLPDGRRLEKWTRKLGSHVPRICTFFDVGATMRALMKLGLNLIAAHCPNTPVDPDSFAFAIRVIRDQAGQIPPGVLLSNGFVHAADVQDISAPGNAHSFRLVHMDQKWHVISSFFGGKVGAYVRVPGPNHEAWRCADIVVPLRSKAWTVNTSSILRQIDLRVEWGDGGVVTPSLKRQGGFSSLSVEVVKKKLPPREAPVRTGR